MHRIAIGPAAVASADTQIAFRQRLQRIRAARGKRFLFVATEFLHGGIQRLQQPLALLPHESRAPRGWVSRYDSGPKEPSSSVSATQGQGLRPAWRA